MKKILVIMCAMMLSCMASAQGKWSCPELNTDLEKYAQIKKKEKINGNKKWSRALLEAFPLSNEGTMKFQYVVQCDSAYDVTDISNSILSWYKIQIPNVEPNKAGSAEHLSCMGTLKGMGQAIGYMTATYVNARLEINVDIKENRVRLTVAIIGYSSANTWSGAESTIPSACYPSNLKAGQKDSHAMAFINCISELLKTSESFVKYLNDNSKTIAEGDDEW